MNPWEADEIVGGQEASPWETDEMVGGESTKGIMPYAREFAGGFNVGLAGMAGAPVDITNFMLSKVGLGTEKPFGGSESIKSGMSKAGDMFLEPQTEGTLGKVVRRAGEEVGASILPAGGITRMATKAVPAYKAATTKLPSTASLLRKIILDPIKASPGIAAGGELVAATGAGIGGGIAEAKAPGSKVAETTGQLIGATAPSMLGYTPVVMATRMVKKLVSRFSKGQQIKQAETAIRDILGRELSQDALKALDKTKALQKKVGEAGVEDWKPTLAEGTASPALLKQQQHIESQAQDDFFDAVTKRRETNQQTIEKYSEVISPKSDLDAQYIINTANDKIDVVGGKISEDIGKTVQKKKDLADGIVTLDRMTSGAAIRNGIQKARADASLKLSARADELGLADIDMSDAFSGFKDELAIKYKPESRFEDTGSMPKIYKQILSDDQPITTFNDIKAIRERISDDIIDELSATTPNRKKTRTLVLMKKDIDKFIDQQGGVLGEKYKQFRQEYFDNYIKPFESGAIFKAKSKDGTGFYKTNDENIAGLFFDNPSASKQFGEIFKDTPEMMKNLESAALDDMKRYAMGEDILNPKKLQMWLKKKGEALEQLPGIKKSADNVAEMQKLLDIRESTLAGRKRSIEDLSLSKQLSRYSKHEVTEDQVINEALSKPGRMAQLKSFIRHDPPAEEALKRLIWGKATSGTSSDIVKFMSTNDAALSILFKKEHLRDMYDISTMKLMGELVSPPLGKAMTGNELPEALKQIEILSGMKIPQFGTRIYAFKSGRVPKSYLALEAAMGTLRQAGKRHLEKIWKEALYDTELSSLIMKGIVDGEITQKTANKIGGRVFALGLPYTEDKNDNIQ